MCLGFIHARGGYLGYLLLPHVLAVVRLGCYVACFIAKRPSERAWLFAHFRFDNDKLRLDHSAHTIGFGWIVRYDRLRLDHTDNTIGFGWIVPYTIGFG